MRTGLFAAGRGRRWGRRISPDRWPTGEARDGEAGKVAIEGAAQLLLVGGARDLSGGGRAAVALAADFEPGGTRLSQALHGQAECAVLYFGFEHAADGVALGGPEVEQAFVVFAGDGVLGLAEVVGDRAVFEDDCAGGLAEEVLHGAGEGVWGHGWKCLTCGRALSVTSDHRYRQGCGR